MKAVHCNLSQNGIDHQVCMADARSHVEEECVDHGSGLNDNSSGFQQHSPGFQRCSPPQRSVSESELSKVKT
ncbi:sterile alpha motif domain-containing protein 12 isoform X2 [Tachysurus ichikawai]